MANATIAPPMGTQTSDFNATVTFDAAVTGFDEMNVQLLALTGNGIMDIGFVVSGSGAAYNVAFTLPEDVSGSFSIAITGMVTPEGGSAEAVMSNTATIVYDNVTNITATFGTVAYNADGEIVVPVTFAEAVIAPSKSVFIVAYVSGDALTDATYYIVGTGTAYELVFQIPPDRKGRFRITPDGFVLKHGTKVWDNVIGSPTMLTVNYDTRTPRIVNFDIPENYTPRQKFYVRVAYNVVVTGWHANNTLTDIFLSEGAHLGTPTPYKWVGSLPPDFDTAVPDDLAGTDWQLLATPPGGDPTPGNNDFDDDGQWHGESGQYFLIEWTVDANATGVFQMIPRDGGVRGPVS